MIKKYLIYNDDCLNIFPKLCEEYTVDLIIIDPPYEISRETNFQSGEPKNKDTDRFRVSMDFGEWDTDFEGFEDVIKHCYKILKEGGTIICFYDLWKITILKEILEEVGFKQLRFIEWVKTNPVPLNSQINYLTNAREIALVAVKKGGAVFNSEYDNGIYYYPIYHGEDRIHPTQKPVDLFEKLIMKHSNEEDLVLDCFMGSGTTGVACMNMNRRFIGVELDEEYYKMAEYRIEKLSSQTRLDDYF